MNLISRENLRQKRKKRVRIKGSKRIPRLSIFKSNKRIYLQLIDDKEKKTLGGVRSDLYSKGKNGIDISFQTGEKIGKIAKKMGIKQAVFDRSGYKFHGKVKAVYEGAFKAGLVFSKAKKKK
jgi:large subunit ribosomal protein L18